MGYESSDTVHEIAYNPKDKNSIIKGLRTYASLVNSGEAFENNQMVAHFKSAQEKVYAKEFKNNTGVRTFLNEICVDYSEEYKENNAELSEILFTETLFFMHAVQYPDLYNEIKTACEAIVNYARKQNDSSTMWISDETCFGLEPLQLVACTYPELGYLLASFMVPNWDDEHMDYGIWAYGAWVMTQGLNEHSLKSFCYCENILARQMALGHTDWAGPSENMEVRDFFPLLKYLRKSKANQEHFKSLIKERLKALPLLNGFDSFDNELSAESYIFELGFEMMVSQNPVDYWDEKFDIDEYLSGTFIEDVAQDELQIWADELKVYATFAEDDDYEDDNELDLENDESIITVWEDLFCKNFEDGIKIWEYINNGDYPKEVLDSIKEEPLFDIINENSRPLKKILEEQLIFTEEKIRTKLEDWTTSLFEAWENEKVSDDDHYERLLRFTDVIVAMYGYKKVSTRYQSKISNGFRHCSIFELMDRYQRSWKKDLIAKLHQLSQYGSDVCKKNLEQIAQLLERHGEEAEAVLTEEIWNQEKARNNFGRNKMISSKAYISAEDALCVSMYLYLNNLSKGIDNSVNDKAIEFINAIALDCLIYNLREAFQIVDEKHIKELKEKDDLSDCEIDAYHKYYEWISFRDYIITGEFSPIKHFKQQPTNTDFAAKNLSKSEFKISDTQVDYNILSDDDNGILSLFVFTEIAKGCLAYKDKQAFERVERFFYSIAPLKIGLTQFKYHLENGELDYYEDLEDIANDLVDRGAPQIVYWSLKLYYLTRDPELEESEFEDMMCMITNNSGSSELLQAYKNMAYSMQLKALKQLKDLNYYEDYNKQSMEMFIQKLSRYMLEANVINDPTVYIHNKINENKTFSKHIKASEALKQPEIIDALYNINTDSEVNCTAEESRSLVQNKREGTYLLLETKGNEFEILYGQQLLTHIKNGFKKDMYYRSQAHLIIIDANCPSIFVKELETFDNMNFPTYVYNLIVRYLRDEITFKEIETVVHYSTSISKSESNYHDFDFGSIVELISGEDKTKILKVLSLISIELLEQMSVSEPLEYYKSLLQAEIDTDVILNYLYKEKDFNLIRQLAQKRDISESILKLKIADQISLLSIIAAEPKYDNFILNLRNSRSPKLKQTIAELIEKYNIHD
ncbi:MAG: hypothetical protein N4A49_00695 [Marinifilaceae bacterium]|jgi:hypothetical protein|nr:hypothetical protein [Marinifilaceae bacterium]